MEWVEWVEWVDSLYPLRCSRLAANFWTHTPPPSALAHFVCTVWPGSDGRRVGMRLMRRWFQADIDWVTAPIQSRLMRWGAGRSGSGSIGGGRSFRSSAAQTNETRARRQLVAFAAPLPFAAWARLSSLEQKAVIQVRDSK